VTASSFAFEATQFKILSDRPVLQERLDKWRRQGLRIGFTNGCFDLVHAGHIKLFEEARIACDRLVVGLNSDSSVAGLKAGRPFVNERSRARVLAALAAVDLVVIFAESTPFELIQIVRPAILVKGGDYRHEKVIGRDIVEADGGNVIFIDLEPGCSTTSLADRVRNSSV
jgi:D-beta-D-heptose 7-phosphate kinase/D-beta-D-heptose 1-phosphate adenosyltransferase